MDFLHTDKIIRLPWYFYLYCKHTKNVLISLDLGFYWFWAALRVVLTLIPQTGYIHPDEYFQTVEVFAGDAFGTEVSLPWEFNKTFPIRSIPVIYLTMYIPFSILRRISALIESLLGFNLLSHYFLLVVPRLSMCLVSFLSDMCLFKICYFFGQNYKERLIIFGSSFVCLVFMTRTFTNTVEITCFNLLLFFVASCMAESEKVNYQNDFLKDKYNEASTISDRVRINKLMKLLPKHSLNRCFPIAIATVSGVFNRPTFILFAMTPLFYWFQRGLDIRSSFLKDFHVRIFIFAIYCIPVICFFIYFDSAYYGYITWGEVLNLKLGWDNFVVTPLNFIKYNLDSSNLAKHGLHPRFLHFLINIPLLFNVLGLSGLLVIAKLVYRSSLSNWTLLPKSQSITGMMTLSFLVPVLGLSLFPHQEPRFIIPILLPLIFLYSHLVRNFDEDCKTMVPFRKRHPKRKQTAGIFKYPLKCIEYFEKATENFDNRYNINGRYLSNLKNWEVVEGDNIPKTKLNREKAEVEEEKLKKKSDLMKLWYLFNVFCVFFFGFLHQGGIYGLSKNFHEQLLVKPRYTTYHLVTSHVYSFPVHLLLLKKNYRSKNTNFMAHELGSENFETVNLKLVTILKMAEAKKKSMRRNYKIFYALPTSVFNEFRFAYHYYSSNYSYQIRNVFYPHFSSEALPNLVLNVTDEKGFRFSNVRRLASLLDIVPVRYLVEFLHQFGLILVQISLPE